MASCKANSDHLELVSIIRGVHRDLRKRYKKCKLDVTRKEVEDELWAEHCGRRDVLIEYSSAMHRLANTHWITNNRSTRIERSYEIMKNYFHFGGLQKELQKQQRRLSLEQHDRIQVEFQVPSKIRVLDVGSCYNPFVTYEDLDVLAIDLCPATKDVHKCDFLNLQVSTEPKSPSYLDLVQTVGSSNTTETVSVETLPRDFFDVVVFCLFLEYFPSRRQRLKCCLVARDLLVRNGLLIVATPDSKHQSRNAAMVKSWKIGFESLGLSRIHYEKETHLHYMAFRKDQSSSIIFSNEQFESLTKLFYIPQDFYEYEEEPLLSKDPPRLPIEDAALVKGFTELPEINFND